MPTALLGPDTGASIVSTPAFVFTIIVKKKKLIQNLQFGEVGISRIVPTIVSVAVTVHVA